jgi:pyruvate formate-lyase activating enzyme-like uncharacterized protein
MINRHYYREMAQTTLGWAYAQLNWLTAAAVVSANRERDEKLAGLRKETNQACAGQKIFTGTLSPGCVACGEGRWSCLFINHRCTARCFFCPQNRDQLHETIPSAEGCIFNTPTEYVEYLQRFGYNAIGISGGECFLVFERLIDYITSIRRGLGEAPYVWLYTNGDLVDKEKLIRLRGAGLNEIRFNLSARNYDLTPVRLAAGIIDTITVETPVVPGEYDRLLECIHTLRQCGVHHVNLHQLVATEYNFPAFAQRGYTMLHYPRNAVLESEMAALQLLTEAVGENGDVSLQYCSQGYKHCFQGRSSRRKITGLIVQPGEELSEPVFIRDVLQQPGNTFGLRYSEYRITPAVRWETLKNALDGKFDKTGSIHGAIQRTTVAQYDNLSTAAISCLLARYRDRSIDDAGIIPFLFEHTQAGAAMVAAVCSREAGIVAACSMWEDPEPAFAEFF